MTWTKAKFRTRLSEDLWAQRSGLVLGDFGVWGSKGKGLARYEYAVTHLPSGFIVAKSLPTRVTAILLAEQIAAFPEWQDVTAVTKPSVELNAKIQRLRDTIEEGALQ